MALNFVYNNDASVSFVGTWNNDTTTGPAYNNNVSTGPIYFGYPTMSIAARSVWASVTDAASAGGKYSITDGDYCEVTIPSGTTAIYLLTAEDQNGGPFVVSVGGTPVGVSSPTTTQPTLFDCNNSNTIGYTNTSITGSGPGNNKNDIARYWRVLKPLARGLSGQNGTQKCRVTVKAASTNATNTQAAPNPAGSGTYAVGVVDNIVWIDAFLFVTTSTVQAATAGTFTAIGDSWTAGWGTNNVDLSAWPRSVAKMLAASQQKQLLYYNYGTASDKLYGGNMQTHDLFRDRPTSGGCYRLVSEVYPTNPEYICMQFGRSDVGEQGCNSPYEWALHLTWALCLIEDIFDVKGAKSAVPVKVSVGTPPWINRFGLNGYVQAQNNFGDLAENMEIAAEMTRHIVSAFSWPRLADTWRALLKSDTQVYPSYSIPLDHGTHANESGVGAMAMEHYRAFLNVP